MRAVHGTLRGTLRGTFARDACTGRFAGRFAGRLHGTLRGTFARDVCTGRFAGRCFAAGRFADASRTLRGTLRLDFDMRPHLEYLLYGDAKEVDRRARVAMQELEYVLAPAHHALAVADAERFVA